MAQTSYGTITITDTTDIENIIVEYAQNQDPLNAPSSGWDTTRPQWVEGYYMWQRTRVHKYGTSSEDDDIGTAVCITGSPGKTGRGLTSTNTQYTIATSSATITTSNMDNYVWSANIPAYDSSKPVYWVRITNIYSDPSNVYGGEVSDGSNSSSSSSSNGENNTVYIIYKDEGLSSAVSMSQTALIQSSTNINSITRLWYRSNSATAPSAPSSHVTESRDNIDNIWTISKPIDKDGYHYYYYCDEKCTGNGTYSWSNVLLDTSNLSQYEIGLLTAKIKNFWWDENGAHAASGKGGNEVDKSTISTYGYNSLMGLNGISFGYDNTKVVELNSNTPALNFYSPPIITNNTITTLGKKIMQLSGTSLTFYNPSNENETHAQLSPTGLLLREGGVQSGSVNAGNNGFIYLSTKDYGTALTIGDGTNKTNWRQIIGTKFGVDSEGNLYASGANITGTIYANAGYVGGWRIGTDGNKTLHNGNTNVSPVPGDGVIILSKGITNSTATGLLPANKTWTFTAGNNFGVTTDGILYTNGANITNINANNITSGSINSDVLKTNVVSAINATVNKIDAKNINASQITVGDLSDGSNYSTTSQMNSAIENAKEITTDIKRGNRVTINYETSDYPAMDITADIDPIQSNLYDSVWVEGCSKNLIDRTAFVGSSGVTITHGRAYSATTNNPDGYDYYSDFTVDGSSTYQKATIGDSSNLLFAPGTYYIKYKVSSNSISPYSNTKIGFANASDEFKSLPGTNVQGYKNRFSVTLTEPCYFVIILNGDQTDGSGMFRLTNIIVSKTDVEYRPYTSNICQITGNDSTDIYLTGENLFGGVANTKFPLYIPAGTEITASYKSGMDSFRYFNKSGKLITGWSYGFSKDTNTNRWYYTHELVDSSGNVADDIYYVSFTTSTVPGTVTDPQIKLGTGIEYTPFGNTYTYQFGRTIYKGQISGTSGVLKQTHALVDLGDFDYTYDSTYDYFYTTDITDQLKGAELMSSAYMYGGNKTDAEMADVENGTICNDTETDSIKIKDKRFTDAVEFKAAITGYQLLYELSAYNTYKLVSHSMNLKKGINHIWSSTGQVHVKYAVMTEEAEEALAAPISESARIATNYITYIDSTNGIKVHDVNDFTNYLQMNASKIALYRNNTEKMQLTDSNFRLGDTSNYISIDSSNIQFYKEGNSTASFGSTIRIGSETGKNVYLDSNGMYIREATSNKSYFKDKAVWLGIDPGQSSSSSNPPRKFYDMDVVMGAITIPPSTTYPSGGWAIMSKLSTELIEYLDDENNTDHYEEITTLSNGIYVNEEATIELIPGSGAYYSRFTLESNKSEWYHSALKVNARLISFEDTMDLRVNDYNIVNTANNYSSLSNLYYSGSGYLTSSNTQILITIPMDRPIAANTVSISSSPTLITRQNNAYTHGSSASTRVAWTVSSAAVTRAGIKLTLTRSTTTNSVNNSPIGVDIYIQRIDFS